MTRKRSRLALLGVLTVVISVTVGLVSGTVADAKKKKKKAVGQVSVSTAGPTAIPQAGTDTAGIVRIPLTVGKKAKGKVVGWDSLIATYTLTGTVGFIDSVDIKVTAPNGRTVFLENPADNTDATVGPLTQTPNSPVGFCHPDPTPPPVGCPGFDADETLGPPFAGTIGNVELAWFGGIPAKGTWTVTAQQTNSNPSAASILQSISLTMTLKNAPV
jgi:hypothetical protein